MESVIVNPAGQGKQFQEISVLDRRLITTSTINSSFGESNDYVEIHIYNEVDNLLLNDYDASDYYPQLVNSKNSTFSSINLEPEKDLKNRGFNRGNLKIQYNFYKKLFNSAFGIFYWIKEISVNRTELKLASQDISDAIIRAGFSSYQSYISTKNYYPTFYLNFGNNQTIIATNVALSQDSEGSYILVKLYEALPSEFDLKSQLWIVDKIADSVSYDVNIQVEADTEIDRNSLRGPNFNVRINNKTGQTTPYYNYQNLLVSPVTSSFQKLKSYYQDKGIQLNIDYSDFSNFIHFSSATERINNFVYKLQLIESSNAVINQQLSIVGSGTAVSSSVSAEQLAIDNIIKNFDIYEYFLYFESSSWAWPKSTPTQPYQLYSVTSSQAQNFLGSENTVPAAYSASVLFSASYYDATNKDLLRNSIPQYVLDDPSNQPAITFLDMLAQHFDNIWLYYKDLSNRYNADNNPNTGISLDVVSDALRSLGMSLYTNTNVSDNLYYTLFGINPDGSLLPPTGSEKITNYITSSIATISANDIQKEIYKRLYHNLPYLYKTKGTSRAIKSLVSIYGIPEEILSITEFGGNFTGSLDGILDVDSSQFKVSIATGSGGNVTGSLTISSSLLSPYTTIQYYEGNTVLNSSNLEIGFSPSDVVNKNITSSLGIFDIQNLIGSPGYQYSSSYTPLVSASNAYFSNYTQRNSVWEYIRLLKFYNNSLFKLIKDFVPARSNVSTGIIIKSHMFERNKYARHEPQLTFNDYSQSIELLAISADNGGAITGSTNWSGLVVTPLGLASYSSSKNIELYTGELSGSEMTVTSGEAMQQGDYISHITGAVDTYNYGAIHQNITSSVRSQILLDLDYNSNQIKPINYNAVTFSISQSQVNNYSTYNNGSNPIAQVQDYNYFLKRSVVPRYDGSKTVSALYNTYTDGDSSFGKTAAIDKIKYQYGYIVSIFSASFQMPYRAKGQIKYLIDNEQNVLNLSKTNTNIFSVQNIFKAGESADVSLFTYNNTNPYIQRLNNDDNDFTIWESGYSYSPLIYNNSGSLTYILDNPIAVTTGGDASTYETIVSGSDNYWSFYNSGGTPNRGRVLRPTGNSGPVVLVSVTASVAPTPSGKQTKINLTFDNSSNVGTPSTYTREIFIPAGTATNYYLDIQVTNSATAGNYINWLDGQTVVVDINSEQQLNVGSTSSTTYTSASTEADTRWYITSQQNQLILSPSQSAYYAQFISSGSYSGLEGFVFPFEISANDIIRLYNYSTSRWDQAGEFRVQSIGVYPTQSNNLVALTLDRAVPQYYGSGSSSYPIPVFKYLVLKRLQDETSIYFNYDLPQPINEEGTLFPQYIGEGIKEGSGNVIKALKQQNLI